MTGDYFLHQHVKCPTHYRGLQKANILDLIFRKENEMIESISHEEPIGKSDHEELVWKYECYIPRIITKTVKYLYDKGKYELM
jgi:hypothetical protein